MNCPQCGQEIRGLACEACVSLRAYQAIRGSQHHYLADLKKDRVRFFAVRHGIPGSKGEMTRWHLALFGDRTHSFCGEEFLRLAYSNRTHLTWRYIEERPKEVCEKCLAQVRELEQGQAIREEP